MIKPGSKALALLLMTALLFAISGCQKKEIASEAGYGAPGGAGDPYAGRTHLLLGRAHRRAGESEKALAELRTALWCRDDPALRREIAELLRSMGRGEEARRLLGGP